jgi:hypothetical protein
MLDIERIISTLRADSGNLDFTGFVTNAYVVDGALRGEVWKHIRADIFGRFADGLRIPQPSGHLFHEHPATDSTMIRPPIPRSSGHP